MTIPSFTAATVLTAAQLNVIVDAFNADTGWTNVATNGGFTVQVQPEVRRIMDKFVLARGGWSNGGMAINGTYTVGVVPSGFRPSASVAMRWGTSTGATAGTGFVIANGNVEIRTSGTLSPYYLFQGIVWTLD